MGLVGGFEHRRGGRWSGDGDGGAKARRGARRWLEYVDPIGKDEGITKLLLRSHEARVYCCKTIEDWGNFEEGAVDLGIRILFRN